MRDIDCKRQRSAFRPTLGSGPDGFTLLELLVALVLFAVLSLMTYSSLRAMIDSSRQCSQESDRLAAVQMTLARLGLDLEQAQPRGIRDEYGNRQPAMTYGALSTQGLEFTRTWRPSALPGRVGGSLQRFRYLLDKQQLIRESWPFADRGPRPKTFRQIMLDRVKAFEVRFLDEKGVWRKDWPPAIIVAPESGLPLVDEHLPRAIEIWLELEDWGRLRRLFPLTPGGQS